MSDESLLRPLIVSLRFDEATLAALDALRRQHFPPTRNHLTAHLTLFHHLPGEQEREIVNRLAAECESMPPLALSLPSVRFLGRGVAIDVNCPPLVELHAVLARAWTDWLTPQDRQKFRPHVTIQNKVDPAVAKPLYEQLRSNWTTRHASGVGLQLWRYLGGPWAAVASFAFRGTAHIE